MKKISVVAILLCAMAGVQSQTYSIDFGTDTGMIRCNTPYINTTLYCSNATAVPHHNYCSANLISSNRYKDSYFLERCQFDLKNPGDTSIGTGSELQFLGDNFADLRFQASSFECRDAFKISFKIKIPMPSPLHWSYPSIMFYFGDKNSKFFDATRTPNFQNQPYPNDTMIFGSVHFRSNGLLPNYCNALDVAYGPSPFNIGEYYPPVPKTITQGAVHTMEIFANSSFGPLTYVSPRGSMELLSPRHFDIYADSVLVYQSFVNQYYRGGDVSAFSWYMNEPSYFASIIIDDIEWSSDFSPSLLPVELSLFDVMQCDEKRSDACLSWRTETEINNKLFVTERSNDGYFFEAIDTILGFGTTTVPHEYTYIDRSLEKGNYYYRLHQVDFDGATTYSEIRQIRISGLDAECDLSALFEGNGNQCKLYDLFGREVAYQKRPESPHVPAGLYLAVIIEEGIVRCREKMWIK